MYENIHEKFLRAIDHMECHPTLGRVGDKPEIRFKRQIQKRFRQMRVLKQIRKMTGEDIGSVREMNKWLIEQRSQEK